MASFLEKHRARQAKQQTKREVLQRKAETPGFVEQRKAEQAERRGQKATEETAAKATRETELAERKKNAAEAEARAQAAFNAEAAGKAQAKVTATKPAEPKPLDLLDKIKSIIGLTPEQEAKALAVTPLQLISAVTVGGGVAKATTTAASLLKVGLKGIPGATGGLTGTAYLQAVNSATAKATTSWLAKLATFAKNPIVIASAILGTIGSYPFAGFIKEEALQTLGFGINSAVKNNDIEGAEAAMALQAEILDPNLWDEIVAKVPYANILAQLNAFYEAAKTKLAIDVKIVADLKKKLETGDTADNFWRGVMQEEIDAKNEVVDYYNQERKKMLAFEEEAGDRDMKEDAKFWRKERAKQRKKETEDREAVANFWMAYRKRAQEFQEDNRPSNLNFGFL